MEESTRKSTVTWQEAVLYLAIAALLGGRVFLGSGMRSDFVDGREIQGEFACG